MFKRFFNNTMRTLRRNPLFTMINLGGLTVGLTAAFIIILFVKSEVGYDKWLPSSGKIYTVETTYMPPTRAAKTLAKSPVELKAAMGKSFPEIESFTRFYAGTAPLIIGGERFKEKAFIIEETFFEIFDLPFVEGSAVSALATAQSIILSEATAQKYFPDRSALGKTITMGEDAYKVTGVLSTLPGKTHLDFEVLMFSSPGAINLDFIDWTSARVYSYFKLNDTSTIASINAGEDAFLNNNAFFSPESWQDYKPSEVLGLSFLPVGDIHLYQSGDSAISPKGSATLVFGFIGVAALIMVMAGINFINLSTANASTREKEIAIHKVVGAKRSQLVVRYLSEALTLVAIAFLFSLVLTELLAPIVFQWIGLVDFGAVSLGANFLAIAAGSSATVGVLAGLYPALHLSAKSPSKSLSGGHSSSPKVAKFRLGLVFVQYTVSIILVIAASHFYLQTRFATTVDLGFSDEGVVSYWGLSGAADASAQKSMLERVRKIPGVTSATRMAQVPGGGSQNGVSLQPMGNDSSNGNVSLQAVAADDAFDQTMGMTLVAGRSFGEGRAVDILLSNDNGEPIVTGSPASIVINEMAVGAMGFSSAEDAIGNRYRMQDYLRNPVDIEIIGVLKNANFQSIHSEMVPMLFVNADVFFNGLVVKLDGTNQSATAAIDAIWPQYIPDVAVYKTYLVDELANQYALEERQTQIFGAFAALAVVIAFLGIFGLAAFNVERRVKEVGVRKVFGATVFDIVRLFIWQFSKPVMWAILCAWPIAGILINNWLQSYAYRIDLVPLVFISAGVAVLSIAWVTIAGHAASAARLSPILALRHE